MQKFLTGLKGRKYTTARGEKRTLSAASVIKVHGVLRAALADAERMDLVARNVAKRASGRRSWGAPNGGR
ncbi:hypothetical protein Athai_63620 [Actinocatenispora thailandica]|uniref:Uncharacterized protein n=1 Tax=Actinocatenispora thailandica TaxID=227318 RepID=A0A7R7DW62_9ACTN|nr:hypothetical protein [Actinocatenispora thailandica]BCJ38859.1 hypothetical protein Athai_63620 [Actinocatenispora thailandica]